MDPMSISTTFSDSEKFVLPPQLTIVSKSTPVDEPIESVVEVSFPKEPSTSAPDLAAEMQRTYQQSAYTVLLQRKTPLLPLLSDQELAAIVNGTSDICTPITLPKKPFIKRVWNGYLDMRASLKS